ncbi:MAG: hypothetical protein ABJY83_17480 [Roseibium sp.]
MRLGTESGQDVSLHDGLRAAVDRVDRDFSIKVTVLDERLDHPRRSASARLREANIRRGPPDG